MSVKKHVLVRSFEIKILKIISLVGEICEHDKTINSTYTIYIGVWTYLPSESSLSAGLVHS